MSAGGKGWNRDQKVKVNVNVKVKELNSPKGSGLSGGGKGWNREEKFFKWKVYMLIILGGEGDERGRRDL